MKYILIFITGLLLVCQPLLNARTKFKIDKFVTVEYYLSAKDTIKTDSAEVDHQLNDDLMIRDTLLQIMGVDIPDFSVDELDSLQKANNDSLKSVLDTTKILISDSLRILNPIYDSLLFDFKKDTLHLTDTIQTTDSIAVSDTLMIEDTIVVKEETYEEFIERLSDSLIFESPDTTYFVIKNIQNFFETDTLEINDTTVQAIQKLIHYKYSYNKIDSIKQYLKKKFSEGQFLYLSNDSVVQTLNDSVRNAVQYIFNSFPEDSLKLVFKNTINDSVQLNTAESQIDSVHFKLFDHRGEYAVLWIKKSDKNAYDLMLEEGTYIEKAKQQKVVARKVDTEDTKNGLKEVRKVDIIVPIWKFGSTADVRFNQGYQSNWVEGGENSLSALSVLRFNADYSYGKKRTWDTDVEYKLGYLKAGDNPLQKNDDRFEFNSKYGRTAFNNWYYSLLFNFKTQFLKGYDYPNDSVAISKFMSPGHLVFSLGLDYKPNKNLTVLISPITSKFTIVSDTANYDQTRFGVGADEKIRKEIGAYIKAIWKYDITKDIHMENKINFFTNYIDNPQNVDIDWELNLKMQLTRYIQMSINTHLIYDDDVDIPVFENGEQVGVTKGLQFREVIGVGFSYNF
ncbi:MAG: DUF3078 domain-containing protein [Thiohalospira sp.]